MVGELAGVGVSARHAGARSHVIAVVPKAARARRDSVAADGSLQVPQDGVDPSVLGGCGRDPSLRKMAVTCFSTVASLTRERLRDAGVGLALGHRGEHGAFAGS